VSNRMHSRGLGIWLTILALAAPGTASAADMGLAAQAPQGTSADDELDDVDVTALRDRNRYQNPQIYFNWLARLVGEFAVEGYVDITPRDAPRDVRTAQGKAICIGFGAAPGVQCKLRVRWPEGSGPNGADVPGGAATLDPAVMLFGFDVNAYNYSVGKSEQLPEYSIKHVLVDNNGISESGIGIYQGADTVESRSDCAAVHLDCERVVRITANPDLMTVEMLITLTIEQHQAVRYVLLMNRVPGSKSLVFGRAPEDGQRQ
jgi:hypothetical protein